mmetsp:Transcript_6022/g.16789  ORF Transcript_6022/g.16789 Transcript_6022/m.16789 type:complete len:219 (-) Transcript_6022:121-777(-)
MPNQEDFYSCIPGVTKEQGPRQPWEDIHCRVEGRIAMDVMANFEERWEKLCKSKRDKLYKKGSGLGSVFEEQASTYRGVVPESDPQSWTCQLFRSIDGRSTDFGQGDRSGLRSRHGRFVDDSIHRAYVHHIRRAERYIYIENQYFLGGSQAWSGERMKEASHIITLELALKICSKIDKGEPFAVYCVVPLYPEGFPAAESVQAILHWQKKTVETMYKL